MPELRDERRGEPAGRLRIGAGDADLDDRGVHLARSEPAEREHRWLAVGQQLAEFRPDRQREREGGCDGCEGGRASHDGQAMARDPLRMACREGRPAKPHAKVRTRGSGSKPSAVPGTIWMA